MRKTLDGTEEDLSLTLERRSRRVASNILTDLDFVDHKALICEEIYQVLEKLNRLEHEAANMGLYCNSDPENKDPKIQ